MAQPLPINPTYAVALTACETSGRSSQPFTADTDRGNGCSAARAPNRAPGHGVTIVATVMSRTTCDMHRSAVVTDCRVTISTPRPRNEIRLPIRSRSPWDTASEPRRRRTSRFRCPSRLLTPRLVKRPSTARRRPQETCHPAGCLMVCRVAREPVTRRAGPGLLPGCGGLRPCARHALPG